MVPFPIAAARLHGELGLPSGIEGRALFRIPRSASPWLSLTAAPGPLQRGTGEATALQPQNQPVSSLLSRVKAQMYAPSMHTLTLSWGELHSPLPGCSCYNRPSCRTPSDEREEQPKQPVPDRRLDYFQMRLRRCS